MPRWWCGGLCNGQRPGPGRNAAQAPARLPQPQQVAVANGNLFDELMETVKCCSLGQITNALFEVGGQYRRNM